MKKKEDLKTFEDACKVLKLDPKKVVPDFSCYPKKDQKAMIAHSKLVIIVRAANKIENKNKEWNPDWANMNEYKYFPWFEMDGSSGFRCDGCDGWDTHSAIGSRLCFVSRDLADYIAKQFIELYKEYFLK